jgi:hypothetical protein
VTPKGFYSGTSPKTAIVEHKFTFTGEESKFGTNKKN